MISTLVASIVLAASVASSPNPVQVQAPEYPHAAVKAQMTGPVSVVVTIDADGSVASADAGGKPNPLLASVCEAAAREWRFEPDPNRYTRSTVLTFEFSLRTDDPADRQCFVGPTRVTFVFPSTVRILGWYKPPIPTSVYGAGN